MYIITVNLLLGALIRFRKLHGQAETISDCLPFLWNDYLAESRGISRESLRRFLICQVISFLATERIFRSRFRVCLPRRCLSADSHCRGIGFKPFFRYARLDIRRMLRISRWSTIVWFSPALPTDAKLSRVPAFQA